ncbi:MAG TPA: MarR family winged helix-turn-helix transcriptional regulator [Chryseosolibacter sp.]|nr:MarR family winged helix-turn-helix transcriptional regulator [Chryseosolibacter sp.]
MQDRDIERIRKFNRFYTNLIGILDRHILESPLSLSEARVLYELCNADDPTARQIMLSLNIDEGYLSRIINRFIRQGLVKKIRSEKDRRVFLLSVTARGKAQFQKINQASSGAVQTMCAGLGECETQEMISMMEGIVKILSKKYENAQAD